jgi:sugar phosphate isomerase/epimerase
MILLPGVGNTAITILEPAMQFAFMTFSCPKASLDEALAMVRRFGYDGLEVRIGSNHAHGVEPGCDAAAARAAAAGAGVAFATVATSCRFADANEHDGMIADAIAAVDLAAGIGAPAVRVFGGAVPTSISRDQAIANVAAGLRSVGDEAAKRGVTVVLETHDDWTHPDHVARVMEAAGSPAVAINWDPLHPLRQSGWTIDRQWERLRPWVRHVHVHDGLLRLDTLQLKPMGTGDIDHRPVIAHLKAAGYRGWVSLEWIHNDSPESHLPHEIAALRRYLAEA